MIFGLIATSSALALLAQLTEWTADRKQASLTVKIDDDSSPGSGATPIHNRSHLENFQARDPSDISKLPSFRRRPGQPPTI